MNNTHSLPPRFTSLTGERVAGVGKCPAPSSSPAGTMEDPPYVFRIKGEKARGTSLVWTRVSSSPVTPARIPRAPPLSVPLNYSFAACRVRGEWEEEEKTGRNETFVAGSVIETGWRREGVEEVSGFWMGNILNNREGWYVLGTLCCCNDCTALEIIDYWWIDRRVDFYILKDIRDKRTIHVTYKKKLWYI